MARVITARRADTCHAPECTQQTREIQAGEQINYGGYNAVTHAACPAMDAERRSTGRRSTYRRGTYRRTYYRCTHEDYPCCGCDADSR